MTEAGSDNHTNGVIESVFGKANGRGIPELSRATLRMKDGSVLEARMPRPVGNEITFRALPVAFEFIDLGVCPICLSPEPTSREHVPPHSIGGNALILTCERCNNEFGSKYEPHLQGWYEGSIGKVKMSGADVDGRRFAGEYLLRENPAGGFILFQQGRRDPEVDRILQAGESFEITYPQADVMRMRVAAVKSAYLAACAAMRTVPRSPRADKLRSELLALRDVSRSQRLQLSPLMKSIQIARTAAEPAPGEIALMVGADAEKTRTRFVISFNRVFAVDWPLEPITGFHEVERPG
ncbi:HNH endonuclease [Microbacterium sp. WHRI 7836]|uniref:HNH endonuclease n=1 Tax=Microbacterium sp. WHRI 7836 TaxID=3162563 RepID=UPI0032EC6FE5